MNRILKYIVLYLIISLPGTLVFSQDQGQDSFLKGKANVESGRYDSALVYLDRTIAINPLNTDARYYKGLALYHKSQFAMAIREFDQVEKVNKGRASIWMARCYARLKDTGHCLQALDVHLNSNYRLPESTILLDPDISLLEDNPDFINFWKNGNWYSAMDNTLAEAGYLIKQKQFPEAINVLSDGLNKGYRKAPLYEKRAEVYIIVANYRLAIEDLNKAIEMDRRNPELLVKRADLLYQNEKYKPALEDYQTAARISSGELSYNVGLAMALNKNNRYEDALKEIGRYLEYYPGNDTAWYQCGMIHFENGNYFEALNCFNNSLRLSNKDARYFAARGATYLKTKTYQYAWKDLAMALDLDPKDAQTYVNKGLAALNLGNNDDACFCFDCAKKLGSKDGFNLSEKFCK